MALDVFKGINRAMAPLLAKTIGKTEFLTQLKTAWYPAIGKTTSIEDEVLKARERIQKSGFSGAFKSLGITDADLRGLLQEIQDSKTTPYVNTNPNPGRNEPCPCGSGLKYKRCHGLKEGRESMDQNTG